ncbi:MAG TPA: hypothetical protein PKK15_24885, partial [Kouleothrix sp.]|nr:hypothetical protein [Kouleothrix sp.]
MQIALDHLPYAARRQPVFAPRGVVATSQPLAAQDGQCRAIPLECAGTCASGPTTMLHHLAAKLYRRYIGTLTPGASHAPA